MSRRGKLSRIGRLALVALLGWGGCGPSQVTDDIDDVEGPATLEQACPNDTCATSGQARKTTGFLPGTIGFVIGPGPGQISIPLPFPGGVPVSGSTDLDIQVLAKAPNGMFSADCIAFGCSMGDSTVTSVVPGPSDFGWVTVVPNACAQLPCPPGSLILSTTDSTTILEIAGIRAEYEPYDECSLVPRRHRRKRVR